MDDESLCPSCRRTRKTIGWNLIAAKSKISLLGYEAGKAGASVLGKAVDHAMEVAARVEREAAPIVKASLEGAKARAEPIAEAALDQVRARGEEVARAAIPLAERAIERAKAYLDKERKRK